MKTGHKIFVVAIIIIMPCLLLSKLVISYVFFEDSPNYKYHLKRNYYQRNPFPKVKTENHNKIILNQLVKEIKQGMYEDVHSLIIIQNDSLVFEEYFGNYHRDGEHDLYEIAGTVTSALIGIAIEQGKIKGIDEKILKYFPEYSHIGNYDERKEKITIADLLTYQAGFEWQESILPYNHKSYNMAHMYKSSDWIKYHIDQPMGNEAGTQFQYHGGCVILLSAIFHKKTGARLEEWASQNLFHKIDVTSIDWDSYPRGGVRIAWNLEMRPIDIACFGLLYLRNGRWNNQQVIQEKWVKLSTKSWLSIENNREYGLNWFRYGEKHEVAKHVQVNDIYFANGLGDQFLWIIPHLNLVVATTGGNFENNGIAEAMLWEYILPVFYK